MAARAAWHWAGVARPARLAALHLRLCPDAAAVARRDVRAARRARWLAARASAGDGGAAAGDAATGAFTTLAEAVCVETEVKKSRFVAFAWPVSHADDAMALFASQRDPAASHNCFAYKVGQHYRSSDDGEPGGTAGRPILAAIEGEGLDGVAVLVTRYFGGTKLGAGGLVRAYGGAAREALRAAAKRKCTPQLRLALLIPFELLGPVYPLLEAHGAAKEDETYDDAAGVRLVVRCEAAAAARLSQALANATSGRVLAEPVADGKADGHTG